MWLFRLGGLALMIGGLGWLLFISYALYTRTDFGLHVLVDLGMPAAMFGTLAGAIAVGAGVWLAGFVHPVHRR